MAFLTKKDTQVESCKLSFIWSERRTAAQEVTLQIALRDCSKEAVGEGQYIRFQCRKGGRPDGTLCAKTGGRTECSVFRPMVVLG